MDLTQLKRLRKVVSDIEDAWSENHSNKVAFLELPDVIREYELGVLGRKFASVSEYLHTSLKKLYLSKIVDSFSYTNTLTSYASRTCRDNTSIMFAPTLPVTSLYACFYGCTSLRVVFPLEISFSGEGFYSAFSGCSSLLSVDTSKWDLSKVTNMSLAFNDCKSLKYLDTSRWDTSSVTSFSKTFYGCTSLAEMDASHWDVSKVTNFGSMFRGAGIETLYASNWDTSAATDVSWMFAECTKLKEIKGELDLSGSRLTAPTSVGEVSKTTYVRGVFSSCSSLETLSFKEGTLKQDLTLTSCPLSDESLLSVLRGLYNWTDDPNGEQAKIEADIEAGRYDSSISHVIYLKSTVFARLATYDEEFDVETYDPDDTSNALEGQIAYAHLLAVSKGWTITTT